MYSISASGHTSKSSIDEAGEDASDKSGVDALDKAGEDSGDEPTEKAIFAGPVKRSSS